MLMKAMAVVARSEDESTGRLRIDLTPADVERIDARANDLRKQIHIEPRFYIPGDTTRSSAIADIARSRCRTAERAVVSLVWSFSQRRETLALVAHYLNELSDYLFVLARYLDSAGEDP